MKKNALNIHPYYFSRQKRIFDIFGSIFLLLLAAPFLLIISALILFKMGTPIFFTQLRSGKDKKPFAIYKFSTMHRSAEKLKYMLDARNEAPFPMFKMVNDPRFVGIGKWLSQVGLDELPQLMNVLIGDMSLIGPRPLPVTEARLLDPTWDFRYSVRPGIFSEWIIDKKRHLSLNEWQRIEQKSLSSASLWMDFSLIWRIICKLLSDMLGVH
jgi:lipopolysaccharide/colanic/teichoic acid biosynthesis glycosyltransferase